MSTLAPPAAGDRLRELLPVLVVGGGLVVGAAMVVLGPVPVLGGLIGLAVVVAFMVRVEWAVLLYVASEPFGDMLLGIAPGGTKAVGALLFASWLFRLCIRTRPVNVRHPAMVCAGVLFLVVLASLALNPNLSGTHEAEPGPIVAVRYLSYLAITVVLVDTMRSGLKPIRVVQAYVVSCGLAAFVGLVPWVTGESARATGPIIDPNDFAFFLIGAVPLAAYLFQVGLRVRRGTRVLQLGWRTALVLFAGAMVLTTMLTLSRGAILGAVAIVLVALLTGWLRTKWVLIGALALLVLVMGVYVFAYDLIQYSLLTKGNVAQQNVGNRFVTWSMAAEMIFDHPVFGVGPSGFATHFDAYLQHRLINPMKINVVHQMLLDVGAELGLTGLAAFLGFMGLGLLALYRVAWSRIPRSASDRGIAVATLAAFSGTFVAAMFLTEQYFLPLWLYASIGIALDDPTRRHSLKEQP